MANHQQYCTRSTQVHSLSTDQPSIPKVIWPHRKHFSYGPLQHHLHTPSIPTFERLPPREASALVRNPKLGADGSARQYRHIRSVRMRDALRPGPECSSYVPCGRLSTLLSPSSCPRKEREYGRQERTLSAPLNATQEVQIQLHYGARIQALEEPARRHPDLAFLFTVPVQEHDGQWVAWAGWVRLEHDIHTLCPAFLGRWSAAQPMRVATSRDPELVVKTSSSRRVVAP